MSEQHLEDGTRAPAPHVDAVDAGRSRSGKSRHVHTIAIRRRVAHPSTETPSTTGTGA